MIRKSCTFLAVVFTVAVLLGAVGVVARAQSESLASAIGQGFSYQGQLKRIGSPYTGVCNFTFRLWDAAVAGTQLGTTQSLPTISVSNGIFTVQLNGAGEFGANAFPGSARWLEISVQCAGDAAPVLLGRQPINATPYASYSINGDMLDGQHAGAFVNIAGGTMTGNLTLPKVNYTIPREHVTSVSSEAFFPTTNVNYTNGGGMGGAYLPVGATGIMTAALQLPDGATVTKFRVYFYDNSPSQDLSVSLSQQFLGGSGGYANLALVTTSGSSTAYNYLETTSIFNPFIDNINSGYLIWVYPQPTWNDFFLRIKGASVYYTLAEAP